MNAGGAAEALGGGGGALVPSEVADRLGLRDARLVPAACAVWAVAWLCVTFPPAAWGIAVAAAALSLGVLSVGVLVRRRRKVRAAEVFATLAVLAAAASLVAVSVGAQVPVRAPDVLRAAAAEGAPLTATGTLTSLVGEDGVADSEEGGGWFGAQVEEVPHFEVLLDSYEVNGALGGGGASLLVFGRLSVQDGGGIPGIGSRVELEGKLGPADAGDSIAAMLFLDGPAGVVETPNGLLEATAGARDTFVAAARGLPGPGAQLLPGLAVGDTRLVTPELDTQMKAAALTHPTAVSGAIVT